MQLRKYACIVLAVGIFLSICGCNRLEKSEANTLIEAFVYDRVDNPHLIAANGDILYTLNADENQASVFSAYGMNGNKLSSVAMTDYNVYDVKCICADENKIYAAVYEKGRFILCSVDINSGDVNHICELNDIDNIEKIGVCKGKLYWLGTGHTKTESVEPFINEEGVTIYFEDLGKKMGSADLENGSSIISEIKFPVTFSVSSDIVTFYAFDSEGGYYFADHATPSEKKYTNKLGLFTSFEFYGNRGEFVFVGANDFQGILPVSKADDESGVISAVNDVYPFYASDICASEMGYVWLKTADSASSSEKMVKRYDLNSVAVNGNPIHIISSQYFAEQPFAAGSEIQMNQLNDEGFALTVLSLDKSYDMAMISSDQGVANDIKEKGSFYPLNDVPGVSEYLDGCFPYIKEAVTDTEGNICMLPITVEIPLIVYNEKNCFDNSIVLSSELEPFVGAVKQASAVSEYYGCTRYWLVKTQLAGYLADNTTFDTEEFRQLAVLLKEQCTENVFKGNFELYPALMTAQSGTEDRYYTHIYEKLLFTELLYRFQQIALIDDENLCAISMPLSKNGKSIAVCTFLCVNPYSDRLSETLGFIENTVSSMSTKRNSCMLSDLSTYEHTPLAKDLYSIYKNGEICFQIPSEIYANDFERYCSDEITLDKFISEADCKLSAYLNE